MNYQHLLFCEKSVKISVLLIIIVIFMAGLWPFTIWPQNEVRWLKESKGIQFYGRGIIYSPSPTDSPSSSFFSAGSFTIELWVQPDTESYGYVSRIFSIYDSLESEEFFIGQWKSYLILRKRILSAEGKETYQEVAVANALQKGKRCFISITSDTQNTFAYIDGRLEKIFPKFSLSPKIPKNANQIILGNSPTGKSHWLGTLLGLAIYSEMLSPCMIHQNFKKWISGKTPANLRSENDTIIFSFSESSGMIIKDQMNRHSLLMPVRFQLIQKVILQSPWKEFRWKFYYFEDIFLNIIGFIPFGFFTSALLKNKFKSNPRFSLLVIVLGFCLSLLIELIQVYLPNRDSQTMDVLTNTLGSYLGIMLFRFKPILIPI